MMQKNWHDDVLLRTMFVKLICLDLINQHRNLDKFQDPFPIVKDIRLKSKPM
jgi:hypothetical protein